MHVHICLFIDLFLWIKYISHASRRDLRRHGGVKALDITSIRLMFEIWWHSAQYSNKVFPSNLHATSRLPSIRIALHAVFFGFLATSPFWPLTLSRVFPFTWFAFSNMTARCSVMRAHIRFYVELSWRAALSEWKSNVKSCNLSSYLPANNANIIFCTQHARTPNSVCTLMKTYHWINTPK